MYEKNQSYYISEKDRAEIRKLRNQGQLEIIDEKEERKLILNTLKKFQKGNIIKSKEEYNLLQDYVPDGWVHFSIRKDGTPTARLTNLGVHHYKCIR